MTINETQANEYELIIRNKVRILIGGDKIELR